MLCLYYRWKISNAADDKTPLNQSVVSHICRCAVCRRYYRQVMLIDERLSKEAEGWQLKTSIPQMTGQTEETVMPIFSRKHRIIRIAAAVILIAGLAALLYHTQHHSRRERINQFHPWLSYVTLSEDTFNRFPSAMSGIATDYYQQELTSLANDTQSAAAFAVSCVGLELHTVIQASHP